MIPKIAKPLKNKSNLPNYNPNSSGSLANKLSVGARTYQGTQSSPQAGKGGLNPSGFKTRDTKAEVKKALLANQAKLLGGKK